ncbi:MAG: hypothetical protein INR72_17590 [Williamsia herbipolensis]|nr:hypothetical protein [Williamsia herbipolensis]
MADERTPRDDERTERRPSPVSGAIRSVLRVLGAVAHGPDVTHGAGGGVVDPSAGEPRDAGHEARRDYRP